jgi:hypothetical protein
VVKQSCEGGRGNDEVKLFTKTPTITAKMVDQERNKGGWATCGWDTGHNLSGTRVHFLVSVGDERGKALNHHHANGTP